MWRQFFIFFLCQTLKRSNQEDLVILAVWSKHFISDIASLQQCKVWLSFNVTSPMNVSSCQLYVITLNTNGPVLSSLICVRLCSSQRKDASAQLGKAEAGWGERLCLWQAAQVQRATERDQLPIPRHCCQEGGGLHACPALQSNDRQQRSYARGENSNVHKPFSFSSSFFLSSCLFGPLVAFYCDENVSRVATSTLKACVRKAVVICDSWRVWEVSVGI